MRVIFYCGRNGSWYWKIVARNGKTIADGSEGYATKSNAERAFARVRTGLARLA